MPNTASRLPCGSACVNALALDALISSGQRIALWGWGREGRAAYRALRAYPLSHLWERVPRRGGRGAFAPIPLTLFCTETEASDARTLNDLALRIATNPSAARLSAFDLVIKSPGISPYRPEALEAAARGTRFIGGTAVWFATRPDARTICVTGSKGKSTTTALLAHLLRAAGHRTALAGNIGLPLLELVDADAEYWAIELSSYQTRDVALSGVRPEIAILTNLFPEHLDWHGDESRYIADKLALLHDAKPHIAILNAADPHLSTLHLPDSQIILFGDQAGWHLRDEWIYRADTRILDTTSLPLPGLHNRLNLCAVLTAIDALSPSPIHGRGDEEAALASHWLAPFPNARRASQGRTGERESRKPITPTQSKQFWGQLPNHLATFTPLPHRLQPLGTRDNILWINDSISTTPHATLAALEVYKGQRIALILGGFDRGLDWTHFAETIQHHPPHSIILLGQTTPRLKALLEPLAANLLFHLYTAKNLPEAITQARTTLGQAGGVILLSPGAPSFDTHRDYTARGQHFAELAGFAPATISGVQGAGII